MSFCTNCGRQLAENEVCNCQKQPKPTPAQGMNPPPMPTYNGKPMYDHLGRPLFTPKGDPITYDENGKPKVKKSNTGCIIAVVVCLLVFLLIEGILAAILVPAMIGYTAKSKTMSANSNAKTVLTVMNSSLIEMDEKGYDVVGTYVICSDKSENLFCSDIDTDVLYETMELYNIDQIDNEWFAVVENGVATYCAVENDNYIGTYPPRTGPTDDIPVYNGEEISSDADFEDVYDTSCENIIPIEYNDIF